MKNEIRINLTRHHMNQDPTIAAEAKANAVIFHPNAWAKN
jgi:hypothetical protein